MQALSVYNVHISLIMCKFNHMWHKLTFSTRLLLLHQIKEKHLCVFLFLSTVVSLVLVNSSCTAVTTYLGKFLHTQVNS